MQMPIDTYTNLYYTPLCRDLLVIPALVVLVVVMVTRETLVIKASLANLVPQDCVWAVMPSFSRSRSTRTVVEPARSPNTMSQKRSVKEHVTLHALTARRSSSTTLQIASRQVSVSICEVLCPVFVCVCVCACVCACIAFNM